LNGFVPISEPTERTLSRRLTREQRKKHKRRRVLRWLFGSTFTTAIFVAALVTVGFATPWGRSIRLTAAETVITTRHAYLAHFLTTPAEYSKLWAALHQAPKNTNAPRYIHVVSDTRSTSPIEVLPLSGSGWNGYAMLVHNPKLVRLVTAHVQNGMGEYISDMVKRTGALAGTNASGFEDPQGAGWGGIPVGLVMTGGQVVQWPKGTEDWTTVGFTKDGVMVMGRYSVAQLQQMGVRDAMQFHPELVVDGKPMITSGDGGWGYDPRTAIGQRKDGTVIFIVINGRFKGGSGMGASQRQVQDEMLKLGAVNACAMDGGSSSVLYKAGEIVNSPSTTDPNHQRHLPDAWLAFPSVEAANAYSR
jgi:exopolysaccharide biosynthesis protein